MKSLNYLLLGILLTSFAAFAAQKILISPADYYRFEDWVGEYPGGFEILKPIGINTVLDPENPILGDQCVLQEKTVIHPWAVKTRSEFVTLSPVIYFIAKTHFELQATDGRYLLHVYEGNSFIQLTDLAEGLCLFSVNDQLAEGACLGTKDERGRAIKMSPMERREYFKTSCGDGRVAWIDARSLYQLLSEKNPAIKEAQILDYGAVKEP